MKPHEGPDPQRLFSIFLDLLGIDSESGGEGRISAYISDFCSNLGFDVHEDQAGQTTQGDCGNLVVEVPGTLPGHSPLILNAHMDTVRPGRGIIALDDGDRFSSGGDTVLGADCKAGLAAILSAAEILIEVQELHKPVELVFTVQEEPGLIGAKHLDFTLVRGKWGVVLDGSGPVGGIVVEAPGQDTLSFTLRGRAAHAGVEPELGVNAISCAADAISGLSLGRLDERTTANIGVICGGHAVNIVPDHVEVKGEIRSLSDERLSHEREAMIESFRSASRRHGCALETNVERAFEHFKLTDDSRPVRLLADAMKLCGIDPSIVASGGGSDANVFNRAGLEMAVMHIGIANAHSKEEYILKDDLVLVTRIITNLAYLAAGENGGEDV